MAFTFYDIPVVDAPCQDFDVFMGATSVTLTLFWSEWAARWSLSVAVAGEPILYGRRLVTGVNLLAGFGFGALFVVDWTGGGGQPGRDTLPSGDFRLIHREDD